MNDISPLTDKAKLIEVILFIENGPLTVDRIKELSGVDKEDIPDCLRELKEHYEDRNSGLMLLEEEGLYSFQPVTELWTKGGQKTVPCSTGDLVYSCIFPADNQVGD